MSSERKRRAEHLHCDGWTMTAIAKALCVSITTISRDLRHVSFPERESRRIGRQREAARLYSNGWTTRAIAKALQVSTGTIHRVLRDVRFYGREK